MDKKNKSFDRNRAEDNAHSQHSRQNRNYHGNRDRNSTHVNKMGMGYRELLDLSTKDVDDIMGAFLQKNKKFQSTLESDMSSDVIILFVRCLVKLCESDTFHNNRIHLLITITNSPFVKNLETYIVDLPYNDASVKRSNTLFWDDIESFWRNMFIFYNNIIDLSKTTAVQKLTKLMDINNMCLQSLHKNKHISDDILQEFGVIQTKLECAKEEVEKKPEATPDPSACERNRKYKHIVREPPNDFRSLSIIPTSEELNTRTDVFLRPNIIDGAYENTDHYLDVQFRLLREDYISPIRDSIIDYRANPNKKRYDGGRFYKNTNFKHLTVSKNCIGLLVSFDDSKQKNKDNKKKFYRRFLYGSLLCFSNDNFENVFFGTVVERTDELLSKNLVVVDLLETNVRTSLYTSTYVMFESDVFFPQYGPILKVLRFYHRNFPMKDYIVSLKKSDAYPPYINDTNNKYLINKMNIDITSDDDWTSMDGLNMDKYQLEAFRMALTREFVTIQGPPGTGKTFIGLKIVSTLIKNLSRDNFPILVLCYTNHALDQFLEGILKTTCEIVRIGGQSKNKHFSDNFNLRNLRKSSLMRNPHYEQLCQSVESIRYFQDFIDDIDCDENIINLEMFQYELPDLYSTIIQKLSNFLIYGSHSEVIRNWLMYSDNPHIINNYYNEKTIKSYYEWSQNQTQEEFSDESEDENLYFDDIFINIHAKKPKVSVKKTFLESKRLSIKYIEEKLLNETNATKVNRLNLTLRSKFCELAYLEEHSMQRNSSSMDDDFDLNKVHSMNPNDRWKIYWIWKKALLNKFTPILKMCEEDYRDVSELYNETKIFIDARILRTAKVIGLTTTAAAGLRPLLQCLSPRIVIVEEAAEVLESHIVVNLTQRCQQVILIGDHQQLRPSTASYRLSKEFGLDISLFERMFLNSNNCVRLSVQHRMRPEISKLITPAIYPDLHDHHSVSLYPNVRGVAKNLFFLNHDESENEDSELSSKSNIHEAEFTLALARYFIQHGYSPKDITIIVAYSGQLFCMREMKKNSPILENVRISVLDNYQGEENKIIILSLVRSNKEGVIGFLKIPNRVCVALSRAKEGLFIIGNMDLLASKSQLWTDIKSTLVDQKSYGASMPLECKRHGVITMVSNAYDFFKVPEGGCLSECGMSLPCNHICERICHVDEDHKLYLCKQKCQRECKYGHKCRLLCFDKCKCTEPVKKILPCDHEQELPCWIDPLKAACKVVVNFTLELCSHEVTVKCFETKGKVNCQTPCFDRLPCGHACTLNCHMDQDPEHLNYTCYENCVKYNKNCSEKHACTKLCHEECNLCTEKVSKKRNTCTHSEKVDCHEDVNKTPCKNSCKRIMPCGHHCKNKCSEPCTGCMEKVKRTRSCGHTLTILCMDNVEDVECNSRCSRLLDCGHKCLDKCSNKCGERKCTEPVANRLGSICGHEFEIPCHLSTSASSEFDIRLSLMEYCKVPCRTILKDCEHVCKGSCGVCQERLHMPCTEPCGITLVCGHSCKDPCRKACTMCKLQCKVKCNHSKCNYKCGVPCKPCMMPCTRKCPHGVCSMKCGDMCDIPACSEPCDKELTCGHPCRGLCGDPCPTICNICFPDKFPELLFGCEDENDSRFVSLVDCPHSVEVNGLDKWVQSNEKGIMMPVCPYCKTPILNTPRYSNIIKTTLNDINAVKIKAYGDVISIVDNLEILQITIEKISSEQTSVILKPVENWPKALAAIKKHVDSIDLKNNKEKILEGVKMVTLNYNETKNLLSKANLMKSIREMFAYNKYLLEVNLVVQHTNFILSGIIKSETNLSQQQVDNFNNEIIRLKFLVNFIKCRSNMGSKFCKQTVDKLYTLNVINDEDNYQFKELLKVYDRNITLEEKDMIVKAMGFQHGHWYKCVNGHYYTIGDCGRAASIGKCPDCHVTIGGMGYVLTGGNSEAPEIYISTFNAFA